MSQKTFLKIIISVIAMGILIMIGGYFYFFTDSFNGPGAGGGRDAVVEFLPFGKTFDGDEDTLRQNEGQIIREGDGSIKIEDSGPAISLQKIVQNPVAGFIQFATGSSTMVRYMEKETGNVFEIDMSIPLARTRITNTTIPRVKEAFFGPNGNSVLLRYVNENEVIRTFFANIPIATSTETRKTGVDLKGSFLEEDLWSMTPSPKGNRVFSLNVLGNSSIGVISDLSGAKKSQIFNSSFSDWLPSWTNDGSILLVTSPASSVTGYAYLLNTGTGALSKIYSGKGLTAIFSPDGKNLLSSEVEGNDLAVKIIRMGDLSSIDTGLKTVAEKCFFQTAVTIYCAVPEGLPAGNYPESWYLGLVSFSDAIWKIDSETLGMDLISNISEEARERIDAINLSATKSGDYLFFVNKVDNSLWTLKLKP